MGVGTGIIQDGGNASLDRHVCSRDQENRKGSFICFKSSMVRVYTHRTWDLAGKSSLETQWLKDTDNRMRAGNVHSAVAKHLAKGSLRTERLVLDCTSRWSTHHGSEGLPAEARGNWSHMSTAWRQRYPNACTQLTFSFSYSPKFSPNNGAAHILEGSSTSS